MPFPAGVITRAVSLPQIIDSQGQPSSGVMTITPSLPLKWDATDQLVLSDPISTDLVFGTATVELPVVQAGFVLQNDIRVDAFTYEVVLSLPAGTEPVPDLVFLLPVGDDPYLLDFSFPAPIPATVITQIEHDGAPGAPGPANSLAIGTVISGPVASASITGTSPNQFLNLVLQPGPAGSPGSIVGFPIGGTVGQIAVKNSLTDYDVVWANQPVGVPVGGGAGQALIKMSSSDFDVAWGSSTGVPNGGSAGQVLTKNSTTNGDAGWQTPHTDVYNVFWSGGDYPAQPSTAPAGVKIRHFYGPFQYIGPTWSGVLDQYDYAELI